MTQSRTIDDMLAAQIEQVWGAGRVELVDELYAAAVVDHMPIPGQPRGREPMKDVVRLFRAAMPDLAMTLRGTVAQGAWGADWWTLTGTHSGKLFGVPATGRRVSIAGLDMVRVEAGRVAELWHVEEMLQLAEQLGASLLAPPPAAEARGEPGWSEDDLDARERRNLRLARRHIEEMWAGGEAGLARELYAPNLIDRQPVPGQRPGVEGIVDVLRSIHEAAPGLDMRARRYVVQGDWVVDRWTMTGEHSGAPFLGLPARGRRFHFHGMDACRFAADGRIVEVHHVEGLAEMRAQLT